MEREQLLQDNGIDEQENENNNINIPGNNEMQDIGQSRIVNSPAPTLINEPKPCSKHCVIIYAVLVGIMIFMGILVILGMIALHSFEFHLESSQTSVPVFAYDTIYIPLPTSPQLLEKIYIKTNSTCSGTLYQVPCEDLHPDHNPSYIPDGSNIVDHIYCLNGSKFVFNSYDSNTSGEVWVSNDHYFSTFYRKEVSEGTLTCESKNKPAGSHCVKVINGTGSVTIDLPPHIGQYFYILRNPSLFSFHVNRFYYNLTTCTNCSEIGPVNYTKANEVMLKKNTAVPVVHPDTCLLMKADSANTCSYEKINYVIITGERRKDILIWFSIFPAIIAIILVIVIVVHVTLYKRRMRQFREIQ